MIPAVLFSAGCGGSGGQRAGEKSGQEVDAEVLKAEFEEALRATTSVVSRHDRESDLG